MNYRFYDTTIKQTLTPQSLKWIINQLSQIEEQLKYKEIKKLNYSLKNDFKDVIGNLKERVNELIS